jgi:RNA polymerase sigma-70 factor (ECF subfamily)
MTGVADQELMVRIANGDQGAFRQLSKRYALRALKLAQRILRNPAVAEEVVQEAFLRLWMNAPRWRPKAPPQAWFFRIVVNLSLNEARRVVHVPLEAAGDPLDPTPDAAAQLEASELDRLIAIAIESLPLRQRAAVLLTYHEGFSNAETAAILGTSVSSVETLLVRAKRTLRATFAHQET